MDKVTVGTASENFSNNKENNQQAQQNSGAVAFDNDTGGIFRQNSFTYNVDLISTQATGLSATATEFLKYTPSYATNIKSKTMSHRSWYTLIVLMLIISIVVLSLFYQNAPSTVSRLILITFFAEFLISGAILLYLFFKDFSFEQFLHPIPVVKIDAATYSLNKMQGKFIPYNAGPLKAPISGAKCVYYSIGLYAAFYQSYGRNRQFVALLLGEIEKGVPTLFTDDSGYLAVDLVKAPNVQVTSTAIELNKAGIGATVLRELSGTLAYIKHGREATAKIMPYIAEAAKIHSTVDLSQIPGYKFDFRFKNRIRDLKEKVTDDISLKPLQNFGLFLVEQYIPVDLDYTCLGGAADTSKSIDGKPVKVMVPDQGRGTMAVYAGAAENIKKSISKRALLNMVIGILFIIAALGLLLLYPSRVSASHSSLPFVSCDNFIIVEPTLSSRISNVCTWNGGTINVIAGGGSSGHISVQIVGADGKEYFNNGTANDCLTNIGSVYLPAQKYVVYVTSGGGGGSCSSIPYAVAILSNRSIKGII